MDTGLGRGAGTGGRTVDIDLVELRLRRAANRTGAMDKIGGAAAQPLQCILVGEGPCNHFARDLEARRVSGQKSVADSCGFKLAVDVGANETGAAGECDQPPLPGRGLVFCFGVLHHKKQRGTKGCPVSDRDGLMTMCSTDQPALRRMSAAVLLGKCRLSMKFWRAFERDNLPEEVLGRK